MKARNVTTLLPMNRYLMPGHIFQQQFNFVGRGFSVVPGAIIHGNFKDANAWSYEIIDLYKAQGLVESWNQSTKILTWNEGVINNDMSNPDPPEYNTTGAYNSALSRVNDKIRGDLDLAIDFAEANQTGKMFKGLGNIIKFAKSGRWKSSSSIANGWLQYQYGWRPLCQDIYGAADSSAREIMKALTHVKASATIRVGGGDTVSRAFGIKAFPFVRQGNGKASCRLDLTLAPRGFDIAQFGTMNPVGLAWELVPYSFVVDWVYDLGGYLKNLESGLYYSSYFQKGFKSELQVWDGKEELKTPSYLGGSAGTSYDKILYATFKLRHRKFRRTLLSSYPLPRLPSFSVNLGSQRLFSAAALLHQILDGEFRKSSKFRK